MSLGPTRQTRHNAYEETLEKSAATEGDFILLSSLLVRSQIDDLTAIEIAGVLVRLIATASVEYAYKVKQTERYD